MDPRIRYIFIVTMLFAVLMLPWWFALIFGISMAITYKRCYELVGFGLLFDTLYGMRGDFGGAFQPFAATLVAIAVVAVIEIVRPFILRMSR